jgi:hypothetical protein
MTKGMWKDSIFLKIVLVIVVVFVLLYIGWFLFIGYVVCENRECFDSNLKECIRTKYVGGSSMIYEYLITGKENDLCNVKVTLLQGELNNQNSIRLEGKEMVCSLPFGVVMNPESDMGNCQGPLKEGLQDLIIQKLHSYLVQNLGRINLEVLDLPV